MNNSLEKKYIQLLKKKIETALALDNSNGSTKASDLEYVAKVVKEKSGISLSLSTLKRIWKENFAQLPQPTTLNALVTVLDYNNWQEFKQANYIKSRFNTQKIIRISIGLFAIILAAIVLIRFSRHERSSKISAIKINGPVHFTTKKTITKGLPNTVIFNYDVSNVVADSFFFQQTWNSNFRKPIDPKGNATTTIYYESGYHKAYLVADDSVIAMQPVYILSNGWEPHIYYSEKDLVPIYFENEKFVENGQLHLDTLLLEKQHVDLSRYFYTRIVNSREFNVSSDNFSLISRIKLDSLRYSDCPWMNVIIVAEKNMFMVTLQKKGCEHYAHYKLGEIERSGSNNDLSALGCNIYQWQEVGIRVKNKNATISINGKACFNEKYKEDLGKIVALIYIFERTGSIDYVKLTDADGQTVFKDDFD